ncbi:MAG: nucleotide sugar dehydrogenase [Planctomycetota bacterium]|jgi:UDP-N-acetyl-D-glucosamine dehydrogenase
MTTASSQTNPPAEGGPAEVLRRRLEQRTATIAVVGLGYVGLPLCRAVHEAGYRVLAYDTDADKIAKLGRGESYLRHVGGDLAGILAASDRFRATHEPADLADADAVLLCVPTPLGPHREPDLRYVLDSTRMVARTLRPGQLVVLESTTYPGTTRDRMGPILAEAGLVCGRDFFLAYSPEREDPGRRDHSTRTIPKLVGGVDEPSGDMAERLYGHVVDTVHRVSSAEVAEAAKLLENVYRAVNIALANELKVILTEMDIDVWEVVAAASTKPFGFEPFYPGPGLGGHCIPIDPFYLAWKARETGHDSKFIELAGEVNAAMPRYVVARTAAALNEDGKAVRGARILVLGIAYKPDVDDIRESPAAEIIERLQRMGAEVSYHDPHIAVFPSMRHHDIDLASTALDDETLGTRDCVIVVTDHAAVDYALVGRHARLVVDTRDAMAGVADVRARVVKA